MSLPIWTPDALRSECRSYRGDIWRFVESQSKISTNKLAAPPDDQTHLEQLIETTKPILSGTLEALHPLFRTPFRYDPVRPGSRFRLFSDHNGVFYASERLETAAAEMAFYKLLFIAESPQMRFPQSFEFTAFSVNILTDSSLDLTEPNLSRDEAFWTNLKNYEYCQALAVQARLADIHTIRYWSVRTKAEKTEANIAVLNPVAFTERNPNKTQTWQLTFDSTANAEWYAETTRKLVKFPFSQFTSDTRLAEISSNRVDILAF